MKITYMKKSGLKKQILIHNNIYKISYDSKTDKINIDDLNEKIPLSKLAELYGWFFKEEIKYGGKKEVTDVKAMSKVLKSNLKNQSLQLFISYEKQNHNISSFIILRENTSDTKCEHIRILLVNPEYQKMKYGLNLLRFSENYAIENGKTNLSVCVLDGNERAKKLYSEYGFKEEYTLGD